ncbi:uncharacterized protein AKAW2_70241S [Aspergillus luchuensis]|uniref:Uncharacterized protein n=1 Tax=Aspergillus kawachii TaxID=1069201 RepID=A0A146FEM4_ASPKA|nr:uncharacterized protein AKAW2_70241S [Aspergillus luchuensis]BCS03363.1 hypothetical protein AKAW2_70241S [Aspergillus luchuensis]BCS14991.1 hypothetical protein ALUC_70224S [Aspergillus luchuensis]GAA84894.1 hypothetical protein AKAW_03008 [Aspergillus luchuensis IFO 4308]GAT24500.1 hypothetical protein RIB2604_01803270 [Aspergillus luchuensis]
MPPSNQRSFELSIRVTRTQGNESELQASPTTPQQLLQLVRRRIVEAEGPEYFEYQQVSLEAGSLVVRSFSRDGNVEQANPTLSYNTLDRVLSVTMSSMTHGSAFLWGVTEMIDSLSQGYFTRNEFRYLMMGGNDGFFSFPAPWAAGSYKEPDFHIIHPNTLLPTVVIECGYYNESNTKLQCDKDLWMLGGAPHVNVVILIKWDKEADSDRVSGWIELHRRGDNGAAIRKDIFPAPAPGTPWESESITLYRSDFYSGGEVPPGRNRNDIWLWSLDRLRDIAGQRMDIEGLVPA